MVVGVFPALKLGVLFVKQISKPLAKFLVNQAKNHPVFRTYFIIPPAQFYHWAEVKAKMYLMNLGKPTKVAKLNEAMAIELGANLMGEVIIFSVAGGCLILEYNRQVAKETKKEEARLAQIQKFKDDIESLNRITSQQQSDIQYLTEACKELAKSTRHRLPEKVIVHETSQDINVNSKTNVETHSRETEKTSLIEQAIVYYENEVKAYKIS
ncbi:optic atrophy 3 protein homolog [Megachile rotundata]|uniref:optic atrophy 3 protein homolog n=1 Tax=Megachile rotundata TaxID=143995 RepID=UPI000258EEB5|nr:PREDICTED: putative OPA3-like protein CG13603 [Megachile rotundata]XP_012150324.1 PREDICTED: putative OPA3-like protein CG13603 [Megachile rotundata]XP_012150325.1 PREDICTED: putative OPA3-like protein CG13603 [Megachile rotundata]XP_012150326.1 PREDICTED: putative OPA3-like protein CG13603 [Megachile rotundata]